VDKKPKSDSEIARKLNDYCPQELFEAGKRSRFKPEYVASYRRRLVTCKLDTFVSEVEAMLKKANCEEIVIGLSMEEFFAWYMSRRTLFLREIQVLRETASRVQEVKARMIPEARDGAQRLRTLRAIQENHNGDDLYLQRVHNVPVLGDLGRRIDELLEKFPPAAEARRKTKKAVENAVTVIAVVSAVIMLGKMLALSAAPVLIIVMACLVLYAGCTNVALPVILEPLAEGRYLVGLNGTQEKVDALALAGAGNLISTQGAYEALLPASPSKRKLKPREYTLAEAAEISLRTPEWIRLNKCLFTLRKDNDDYFMGADDLNMLMGHMTTAEIEALFGMVRRSGNALYRQGWFKDRKPAKDGYIIVPIASVRKAAEFFRQSVRMKYAYQALQRNFGDDLLSEALFNALVGDPQSVLEGRAQEIFPDKKTLLLSPPKGVDRSDERLSLADLNTLAQAIAAERSAMTLEQAAQKYKMPVSTVSSWSNRGELKTFTAVLSARGNTQRLCVHPDGIAKLDNLKVVRRGKCVRYMDTRVSAVSAVSNKRMKPYMVNIDGKDHNALILCRDNDKLAGRAIVALEADYFEPVALEQDEYSLVEAASKPRSISASRIKELGLVKDGRVSGESLDWLVNWVPLEYIHVAFGGRKHLRANLEKIKAGDTKDRYKRRTYAAVGTANEYIRTKRTRVSLFMAKKLLAELDFKGAKLKFGLEQLRSLCRDPQEYFKDDPVGLEFFVGCGPMILDQTNDEGGECISIQSFRRIAKFIYSQIKLGTEGSSGWQEVLDRNNISDDLYQRLAQHGLVSVSYIYIYPTPRQIVFTPEQEQALCTIVDTLKRNDSREMTAELHKYAQRAVEQRIEREALRSAYSSPRQASMNNGHYTEESQRILRKLRANGLIAILEETPDAMIISRPTDIDHLKPATHTRLNILHTVLRQFYAQGGRNAISTIENNFGDMVRGGSAVFKKCAEVEVLAVNNEFRHACITEFKRLAHGLPPCAGDNREEIELRKALLTLVHIAGPDDIQVAMDRAFLAAHSINYDELLNGKVKATTAEVSAIYPSYLSAKRNEPVQVKAALDDGCVQALGETERNIVAELYYHFRGLTAIIDENSLMPNIPRIMDQLFVFAGGFWQPDSQLYAQDAQMQLGWSEESKALGLTKTRRGDHGKTTSHRILLSGYLKQVMDNPAALSITISDIKEMLVYYDGCAA
ncbi:MAG: hypothetical protein NTY47_08295, partial [Candidatus Omnitrophica bacterium]|nr:hypothetical protein [Candidatus Omnitrophota bacterium]